MNPLATRQAWGYQLLVDGRGGDRARLADASVLARLSDAVVAAAGMRAYGEPVLGHFGHADPATTGWTLVQLIETSSLTVHALELTGDYYVDLFSCKPFPTRPVLAAVAEAFGGQHEHRYLVRGPRRPVPGS